LVYGIWYLGIAYMRTEVLTEVKMSMLVSEEHAASIYRASSPGMLDTSLINTSLTLRKEHKKWMFENKAVRRIFEPGSKVLKKANWTKRRMR
jgi:hypothetical protein